MQSSSRPFITTVAAFFGKKTEAAETEPEPEQRAEPPVTSEAPREEITRREQVLAKAAFYRHWNAIKADGISASQFIEFLQPLADLDGISVAYIYNDEEGKERVYNRRRDEPVDKVNPLTRAIQEKKLTKDKAMTFALNEEGRVWIESNFMDLKDIK